MARRPRRQGSRPESEFDPLETRYVVGIDPATGEGYVTAEGYTSVLRRNADGTVELISRNPVQQIYQRPNVEGTSTHNIEDLRSAQIQYHLAMARIRSYVQRDLEDQIAEEIQQRQQMSDTQSGSSSAPRSERPKVKISEVVSLLNQGYTRFEKDDKGFGSVQKKLGLTHSQTQQLFQHEALKGLKTKTPSIEIIDDRPKPTTTTTSTTTSSTTTSNPFE